MYYKKCFIVVKIPFTVNPMIIASHFFFFLFHTFQGCQNFLVSDLSYSYLLFFQVAPIKDHLSKACPHGNNLILDSEVIISCSVNGLNPGVIPLKIGWK